MNILTVIIFFLQNSISTQIWIFCKGSVLLGSSEEAERETSTLSKSQNPVWRSNGLVYY